jgi:NADPH:quinone reductase-like Zn-dependent oxidoreductase
MAPTGLDNVNASPISYWGKFPGNPVLWHADASITGIQLSKSGGASAIYLAASSQENIDICVNELGATQGFNSRERDFVRRSRR